MERLRELRQKKRISQRSLAMELGITGQTLSNYEVGTREPSHEMVLRLADYFNVTTDYLLGRDNPPPALPENEKAPTSSEEPAGELTTAEIVQRYLLDRGLLKDKDELPVRDLETIGGVMELSIVHALDALKTLAQRERDDNLKSSGS